MQHLSKLGNSIMLKIEHWFVCCHRIVIVKVIKTNKIWINSYGLCGMRIEIIQMHCMNQEGKVP